MKPILNQMKPKKNEWLLYSPEKNKYIFFTQWWSSGPLVSFTRHKYKARVFNSENDINFWSNIVAEHHKCKVVKIQK